MTIHQLLRKIKYQIQIINHNCKLKKLESHLIKISSMKSKSLINLIKTNIKTKLPLIIRKMPF